LCREVAIEDVEPRRFHQPVEKRAVSKGGRMQVSRRRRFAHGHVVVRRRETSD
jgi:hypothetical protein